MTLSAGCYAAGYVTGLLAFIWMAYLRRMANEDIFAILAAGLIGGLLCANVAQLLVTNTAGKTVLGGIAGGYMFVLIAKRLLGITRPTGDLFAVAICAGEAVGRWGCFFGGCCYGKPTTMAWAVWQHNAFRHPAQIYLSLANLLILLVLLFLQRQSEYRSESRPGIRLPENTLFCVQGALYCVARFLIEFWRFTPDAGLLTRAQWACMAGFVFFCVYLFRLLRPVGNITVLASSSCFPF